MEQTRLYGAPEIVRIRSAICLNVLLHNLFVLWICMLGKRTLAIQTLDSIALARVLSPLTVLTFVGSTSKTNR